MRLIYLALLLTFGYQILGQIDSIDFYVTKARTFEYRHFDSMFYYSEKIRSIAEAENSKSHLAKYHAVLGVALEELGNYDSAKYHDQLSLEFAIEVGDSVSIAVGMQNLGVVSRDLGDLEVAIDYFFKSLAVSEPIDAWYVQAKSHMGISQVHHQMGKFEEGIHHAENAIRLAQIVNNERIIAGAKIEIGNNLVMLGKLDEALVQLLDAEKLSNRLGVTDGLAQIINTIGAIHFFQGDFLKAIESYQRSKELSTISEDRIQEAIATMNIGEAYIYLKEFNKAEYILLDAATQFKKLGNKGFLTDAYQYLLDLEKNRNDFKKALKYYELKDVYRDSIMDERSMNQIAALKLNYETEKKEQEIVLLTTQQQLQEVQIQRTTYLVWGITGFSIVIIATLILFSSSQRYKLKAALAEEKAQTQKSQFKAVISGEEKERKRIAQDLHDGLGQLLSTARITVSTLEDPKPDKIANSLKLIDLAVKEVRTISHNMMPHSLINVGLKETLEDMMRMIGKNTGIQGKFECSVDLKLDEPASMNLYRVIQEIVNNALKYSEATTIELHIERIDEFYEFVISDNGVGFDLDTMEDSEGIGWSNIHSRVDMLNGIVDVDSSSGDGTSFTLKVPTADAHSNLRLGA